jgi:hypothetical protein
MRLLVLCVEIVRVAKVRAVVIVHVAKVVVGPYLSVSHDVSSEDGQHNGCVVVQHSPLHISYLNSLAGSALESSKPIKRSS